MNDNVITRFEHTLNYIEANIESDISIEMLEQISCMSKSVFYQLFTKIFNIPIKEYINKRRLTLAAEKLVFSQSKIIDIAFEAMYQSPESFSRKFKTIYGLSPTAYRQLGQLTGILPPLNLMEVMLKQMNHGGNMRDRANETIEEYLIEVTLEGDEIVVQTNAPGTVSSEVKQLDNGEIEITITK